MEIFLRVIRISSNEHLRAILRPLLKRLWSHLGHKDVIVIIKPSFKTRLGLGLWLDCFHYVVHLSKMNQQVTLLYYNPVINMYSQ